MYEHAEVEGGHTASLNSMATSGFGGATIVAGEIGDAAQSGALGSPLARVQVELG